MPTYIMLSTLTPDGVYLPEHDEIARSAKSLFIVLNAASICVS